jgi:hypothetical protein
MALNVCAHCTTHFAVGAEHCPQCGNADYYLEGSMAKITVHGGPSDKTLPQPEAAEAPETTEPVVEAGVEAESAEPLPYEEWSLADLQAECVGRGLTKSGNKADLVLRLKEDDAQEDEPESEESEEEVQPVF